MPPDDATSPSLDDEGMPDLAGPLPEKAMTGDPQEGLSPPADAPRATVDFGTTAEEQRQGESLDLRLARENPDVAPPDDGIVPELVGDPLLDDREDELVDVDQRQDPAVGRSAEEDAVHVVDEPV
jgi:hypothetical protein